MPYIHIVVADKWNEFFSISCDWFVGVSVNFQNKQITPISIEEQSDTAFFVSEVTTEKSTFISEIPRIKFKRVNNRWNASFLRDINSVGGLYSGQSARGYYVNVLFVRDNTVNSVYNSINVNKRTEFSELDSILIKVAVQEQSGFLVNV